jgi:hypothetical protein
VKKGIRIIEAMLPDQEKEPNPYLPRIDLSYDDCWALVIAAERKAFRDWQEEVIRMYLEDHR